MPGMPRPSGGGTDADGASFKDALLKSLNDANQAQVDATRAVEDLTTGQRNDVESVIIATQKADNAFRMLQALRNRMMDAYEEVKQMRV
jgi:flagellar hook-basal body complex protein FliE